MFSSLQRSLFSRKKRTGIHISLFLKDYAKLIPCCSKQETRRHDRRYKLNELLIAPAERADVIVDFTNLPVGTEIILLNIAPDDPFGGGTPGIDFDPSDPATTGQVMQFRVVASTSVDPSTPPMDLTLPAIASLGAADATRKISLNEEESKTVFVKENPDGSIELDCSSATPFGPTAALLGTVNPDGSGNPLLWSNQITENPQPGDVEEWEIHNFTEDAHPIHVHLIQFQVVNREDAITHAVRGPEAWETGYKDTVIAYPGEITRIKAKYDLPGLFVWHCHILEHEDNEMMRPFAVGAIPPILAKHAPAQKIASNAQPTNFELEQNYPNPFNPATNIRFQIPRDAKVELKIFNSLGQEVRTLVNQRMKRGQHIVTWNGRDNRGRFVSSGTYIYQLRAGKFRHTRKMSFMR